NLVTVYDVGIFGGRRGVVTETTARKLSDGHAVTSEQLRRVTQDYLTGLHFAHCAGLVHGGIDADTLFLAHDGSGKLADVGLATVVARAERGAPRADVDADLRALASTLLKQSDGRD